MTKVYRAALALRAWRKGKGYTQQQVADMLGLPLRTYRRWENEEREVPTLLPLALAAKEQGLPPAF